MGSRVEGPPPGALTVPALAKMMNRSRNHTNFIMKGMFEAGEIDRVTVSGKLYYFEKK
jgi:predicted transcriptional regulator